MPFIINTSLQNLGNIKEAVGIFDKLSDAMGDVKNFNFVNKTLQSLVKGLSLDDAIDNLQKLGVEGEKLTNILGVMGYDVKDVSKALLKMGSSGGKSVSMLTKLKTGFSGLTASIGLTVSQLGWAIAAIAALTALGVHLEKVIVTAEESREELASIKDNVSVNETELASMNGELEKTAERITELRGLGELTFTQKEELSALEAQNAALEKQIALLEARQALAVEESSRQLVDAAARAALEDMPDVWKQISDYEDNISKISDLDKEYANNKADEKYTSARSSLVERNKKIQSDLLEYADSLSEMIDGMEYIETPLTDADRIRNNAINSLGDYYDQIAIAMGINGAKEHSLSRLTTQKFDDQTDSLKALGKQGKVTAEILEDDAYSSFIDNLVSIGVIPDKSVVSLKYIASYFNDIGDAANVASPGVNKASESFNSIKDSTSGVISELDKVTSLINEQSTGTSISTESYDELIAMSDEYADCLEYQNGAMQLNADKLKEVAKARAEDQSAAVTQAKASAQIDYLKNSAEIERLNKILNDSSKYKTQDQVEYINANIAALSQENDVLLSQIDKYNILAASIAEAQSAYQHWINAQNASQSGDMFDGSVSALSHIDNTLNNKDSEFYGKIGRSDYRAAVDFVVPDSVDHEDQDAVRNYIDSISDMFTYDGSGNRTGLNIANFLYKAEQEGLMKLSEDGKRYEIVGEQSMEHFAEGLGLSLPLVQAIFGELEEYGAKFDWSDEAIKTVGDLGIEAEEAYRKLRNSEGDLTPEIELDLSKFDTAEEKVTSLESSIKQMQDFRSTLDVDSSDYEYAQQVIEYLVRAKQELSRPEVMNVDTSLVEGKVGEALKLIQRFQTLYNQRELNAKLGLGTEEIDGQIAEVQEKIKGIDPTIKAELGLQDGTVESLAESIAKIDADTLTVKLGVNPDAIIGYVEDHPATGTVTWENNDDLVKAFCETRQIAYGDVIWDNVDTNVKTTFYANGYINWGAGTVQGRNGADGTAHASGTALAGGNWGTATGGTTLVGELGQEIVVNPRNGRWYTVGDNGAQFVDIPRGAIVFNHKQTESLLKYGHVSGRGVAQASGTALATGYIPNTGMLPGSVTSGRYHSSHNSGSGSSSSDNDDKTFEEMYDYHQHLIAMEQERTKEYLDWLEKAYKEAYENEEIELEDFYKYEEEVFDGRKELFRDYLGDIEHAISALERTGDNDQIINLYLGLIQDINNEIAAARARGLNDNDDYIQELLKQLWDYQDAIEDIQDEATDGAKAAIEDLIDYRIDMLKQDLDNEKDALEERKNALKDFYDEQKDMLQDAYDEEKRIEERNEKRKAKFDIEAELAELEFDDSAWAQKRKLELQEELAEADKDLTDFEKESALDDMQDLLDSMYEKQAEQLDSQIEAIEEKLNDPEALYNQALKDIQDNTEALYEEMAEYNAKYGTGNPEDVKEMWDEAKASLDEFLETFGQAYKDIILVASPGSSTTGYASGTRSASPGIHKVDENGAEYVFTSSDGNSYRVFSGGEKVLNAGATDFLYDFAVSEGRSMKNMFYNLLNAFNFANVQSKSQPIQLTTGDIIVQGNADQKTISEIRRAQRDGIDYILKQFTKLNK